MGLNDKEREKIKKEAKDLLDNFEKQLEKVNFKVKEKVRKDNGMRPEGKEANPISKKIMFENAPESEDGFLIAEKKVW